jgi:glycosyltransferase involved in cell wall biosynthesis
MTLAQALMKIGIDIRETVHEKAGKGYYAAHLVDEILKQDKVNQYILYTDCPVEIYRGFKNAETRPVGKKGLFWHKSVLKDAYKENLDVYFSPTSYIIPAIHNPKKLKVVMTVHDLVAFLFPQRHNKKAVFTEKFTLQKALKKVVKVLSVSENTKRDLVNRFNCKDNLVDIVSNAASEIYEPIPEEIYDHFKDAHNLPEKFIFCAGTLEPRKNYPTLLRGFAEVVKKMPDVKLLIAGKRGWMFDEIYKTVHDLGIDDNVRFLGYVPERDLVYLYNLATVFVWPSLYEGFGIPPLEAMQSGCPVITSNTSSLPEVVGKGAITVDPYDEKELADAMIKVLKDSELSKELIRKGFNQSRKFSWKLSADRFLDIIKSL